MPPKDWSLKIKLYLKFSEPIATYGSDKLSTIGTISYVSNHDGGLGFVRRIIFSQGFQIPQDTDFEETKLAYIADLKEAFAKKIMETGVEDAPKTTFIANSSN